MKAKESEGKLQEPEEALRQASDNDMYRFLGWCLKLTRGTDNRRLKGIRKSSTLETDWKTFCGYYEMVTKTKIDGNTSKEVRRVSTL